MKIYTGNLVNDPGKTPKGKHVEESSLFIISLQTEIQIYSKKTNNLSLPKSTSKTMPITEINVVVRTIRNNINCSTKTLEIVPKISAGSTTLLGNHDSINSSHVWYKTPRKVCPKVLLHDLITFNVVRIYTAVVWYVINVQPCLVLHASCFPQFSCSLFLGNRALTFCKEDFSSSTHKFTSSLLFSSLFCFSFTLDLLLRNEECLLVFQLPW